jgi:histidine triad (HIT) family protein
MPPASCPFCQIVAGTAPAEVVYADGEVTAFQDRRPLTPVHILIVPNEHIESVNAVEPEHQALLGRLFAAARLIAFEQGLAERGYRLIVNTGPDGGQTVFHLHMHLMGGRRLPFRFDGKDA